jgi:hypothetical protein
MRITRRARTAVLTVGALMTKRARVQTMPGHACIILDKKLED